ncbi:hypothetical protein [Geodermatophilus sp. SYSU D00700]
MAEPGSLHAAVTAWLAEPDVLADPEQRDGERVWTRAEDILPGATIRDGQPAVAAWGEVTWRARPRWDPDELTTLWLTPVGSPATPPQLDVADTARQLTQLLMALLAPHTDGAGPVAPAPTTTGPTLTAPDGAPPSARPGHLHAVGRHERTMLDDRLHHALTIHLLDDHAAALAALVSEISQTRALARDALSALARLSPAAARALAHTPAGRDLHRWARLPPTVT